MRILTELRNDGVGEIYIENIRQNRGDILIHLIQNHDHLSGYYLCRIYYDGISLMNDVGNTDNRSDFIRTIDVSEGQKKLRIIGVDMI